MNRTRRGMMILGAAGLAASACLAVTALADPAIPQERINRPNGPPIPVAAKAFFRPDITKGRIELPVKRVLAARSGPAAKDGFVNPKVEPGKVTWHADFAAACAAAQRSKKPVLLFQMMGRLDNQFC